jgi:hypothetical protein
MNSPLPEGAFRESSTPDSFSSAVTNKKRKVAESAEKSMQHHSQYQQDSLELQRSIMQQQKQHQQEMVKQQQITLTLQSAMRREEIRMLEVDIDNNMLNEKKISKELGVLRQQFNNHCKQNGDNSKQDPKVRLKAHKARIADREDNFDSDGDESVDSQTQLMDEILNVKELLEHAKTRFQLCRKLYLSAKQLPS